MKKHIIIFLSLVATGFCYGQEVVATAGQTNVAGNLIVSQTIGETVIHSHENGVQVDQGFQQNEIMIISISEQPDQFIDVSIFPNPFAEHINVNSDQDLDLVQVYDLAGSIVATQSMSSGLRSVQMDLSALSAGQYLLRVQSVNSNRSNTYSIIKR